MKLLISCTLEKAFDQSFSFKQEILRDETVAHTDLLLGHVVNDQTMTALVGY